MPASKGLTEWAKVRDIAHGFIDFERYHSAGYLAGGDGRILEH